MQWDNSIKNVWQVGAGSVSRTYADVFLNYGVALIGPGDAGPWRPELGDDVFEGSFVRRFATEIEEGDIILLRTEISTIQAVGIIVGDYRYLSQFDDVNGWNLQHARRVRWFRLPEAYTFDSLVFGANPPRLSRVGNKDVVAYAIKFIQSPPMDWQAAQLPDLPKQEQTLVDIPEAYQEIVAQAQDLIALYRDRQKFGEHPTEDELVAHFAVPFLRSLSWPVENIAIKWRNIDVSVFHSLPRNPDNCHFIIEAKRLGAGVEGALEQAMGYVENLDVPCDVVVTDGIRYRFYEASKGFLPVSYANFVYQKRVSVAPATQVNYGFELYYFLGQNSKPKALKESALELFDRMKKP